MSGFLNTLFSTVASSAFQQPIFKVDFTNGIMPTEIVFSRDGHAMMYDSTGKLTYAPNNLVIQSEDLDHATWYTVAVSKVGGQNDPFGGSSAANITETTSNDLRIFATSGNINYVAGAKYIASFCLKNLGSARYANIHATDSVVNGCGIYVNLSTGEILGNLTTGSGWTATNATSVDIGGGWYRYSFTFIPGNSTSAGNLGLLLSPSSSPAWATAYTGDGASGVTACRPQVEAVTYQTTPRAYNATTSAAYYGPRFDYRYNGSTLEPAGLLIEGEARTNYAKANTTMWTVPWAPENATATQSGTSIDGTDKCTLFVPNTSNTFHRLYQWGLGNTSNPFTLSLYVKPDGYTQVGLREDGSVGACAVFDLTGSGSVVGVHNTGGMTVTNPNVEQLDNGWYRISAVFTPASSIDVGFGLYVCSGWTSGDLTGNGLFAGDGTSGVYVSYAQYEIGSRASSPITVGAASVTRDAERVTFAGAALTALQGSAFTLFVEALLQSVAGTPIIVGNDASASQALLYTSIDNVVISYDVGGTPPANANTGSRNWTAGSRAGFSADGSGQSLVMDGGTVTTSASALANARTSVALGSWNNGVQPASGWYRSIAIFDKRLINANLQSKSVYGASY